MISNAATNGARVPKHQKPAVTDACSTANTGPPVSRHFNCPVVLQQHCQLSEQYRTVLKLFASGAPFIRSLPAP
jgi:hypothetical protein